MQNSISSSESRLPYLPGLDGLRALSVLAVFFYHARLPWVVGGYLGVESFFVISGYLITALLLREYAATQRIGLSDFWLRRARRLLPALWLVLAATVLLACLWTPDALARLREDIPAALLYLTNWVFIAREAPYFEQFGRPPLLQHLWSLAVEEQFYIVWPLVLGLALRAWRVREGAHGAGHTRRLALPLVLAGGLAFVWMATLHDPSGDPTRVYYGADTRAGGFLLGAALATVAMPGLRSSQVRWAFDGAGLVGLIGLIASFTQLDEYHSLLYRGGFMIVDVLTALVIVAVSAPETHLAKLLGNPVLSWVGARSYGIYLWHWPLMVLGGWSAAPDGTSGMTLTLQLIATFCLADLSYRWVEQPIRRAGFQNWGRAIWSQWGGVRQHAGMIGSMVLLVGGVTVLPDFNGASLALASAAPPATVRPGPAARTMLPMVMVRESATSTSTATRTLAPSATVERTPLRTQARTQSPTAYSTHTATPSPSLTPASTHTRAPAEPTLLPPTLPPVTQSEPAQPPATAAQLSVTLIGDSVMEGVAPRLEQLLTPHTYYLTARRSRRMGDLFALIPELAAQGRLASTVVIHLGTNQAFDDSVFDGVMQRLVERGVTRVIFLNVKRPVVWEAAVNWRLAAGVSRWPQAELVDWNAASHSQPSWFGADEVHPTRTGVEAYIGLLLQALGVP